MGREHPILEFGTAAERTVNARDWEAYGRLFEEDVAMRFPGAPGEVVGRAARVEFVRGIMRTFPDGRISVVRSFGEGDWGCVQFRFQGTNTGPVSGPDGEAPGTGRPVAFPYCVVARFVDGRIAELDEYFDQLAMLQQLGLAP